MADRKISDLTALTTPATGDLIPIVDVSEAAAADKNKSITVQELFKGVPDGTAAAPGLAFESDDGNGIFLAGTDQVGVATGGVERVEFGASEVVFNDGGADYDFRIEGDTNTALFFVDASTDRVGVGTTSPQRSLHIAGGTNSLVIERTDATTSALLCVAESNQTAIYSRATNSSTTGRDLAINIGSTEAVHIDSSGRVGIGTSSPGANLELGPVSATEGPTLRLSAGAGGGSAIPEYPFGTIEFFSNDTGGDGAEVKASIAGVADTASTAPGGEITFSTKPFGSSTSLTERLRIDSSGNVGIGTTNPAYELAVHGAGNSRIEISNTSVTGEAWLHHDGNGDFNIVNRSTTRSTTFYTGGAESARINSSGYLLVGTTSSSSTDAYIQSVQTTGQSKVYIESKEVADLQIVSYIAGARRSGGSYRYSELGIFKHSGITETCSYLRLQSTDGATNYFWTDDSDQFRISTNTAHIGTTSGTVVGTQTSDERIKNILGSVDYGLDTIKQIEPVRFALKSDPDTEKLGFIAQQVQPLIPQSVFDTGEHIEGEPEDAPTKLGMEYVALIPVLVNAIKELSAEVDSLKAQLS